MSSSRLAKLRNKAGVPAEKRPTSKPASQHQQGSNAPISHQQILVWHEQRLKELQARFDLLEGKQNSIVSNQSTPSTGDANKLIVVNNILEKIAFLTGRLNQMEIMNNNMRNDYLNFKRSFQPNSDSSDDKEVKNRVILEVSDRITALKNAEKVANSTTNEVKEMKETLEQLNIQPTSHVLSSSSLSTEVTGIESSVSNDLAGAPI